MGAAEVVEKIAPVAGTLQGLGAEYERIADLVDAGSIDHAVMMLRDITAEPFGACHRMCEQIRRRSSMSRAVS